MSLESLKNRVGVDTAEKAPTLAELVRGQADEIARQLPATIDPEKFVRSALTVIRQTPGLQNCSWPSIAGALMTAAQVGLEPGPLGHCWLIPRWNSRTKTNEATFQLGWTGVLELARRSGRIGTVDGGWVFDGEIVEERYGTSSELVIRPVRPRPTDRDPVAYWVSVEFLDGSRPRFRLMDRAEIEAHARRHAPKDKAGNLAGAWASDFHTMAVISVFRSMRNWLPLSPEMHDAMAAGDDTGPALAPVAATRAPAAPLELPSSIADGGPVPDGEPFELDQPVEEISQEVPAGEMPVQQPEPPTGGLGAEQADAATEGGPELGQAPAGRVVKPGPSSGGRKRSEGDR